MRGLGFVATGLLIGSVAALLWARFAPATGPVGGSEQALGLTVGSAAPLGSPAGIQARARDLASRIARQRMPQVGVTEAELIEERPAGSAASIAPGAALAPLRQRVYRADRATLARLLAAHDREGVARPWGRGQGARLQRLIASSTGAAPREVQVACGAKTCVVRLAFASAAAREAYLEGADLPTLEGCHSVTAQADDLVPSAPFEATVIYMCS